MVAVLPLLCVALSGSAHAAVTVGPPLTASPNAEWTGCDMPSCTALGPVATQDGVLVGVRMRSADDAQLQIRVLRPSAGGTYTTIAQTLRKEWAAPDAPTQRVTRMAVRAGDVISATSTGDLPPMVALVTGATTTVVEHGAWEDGAALAPTLTLPSEELQMQATIEPDRDGDGFGDDTQDLCPTQPEVQASACQSDLGLEADVPAWGILGQAIRHTFVVRNRGPHVAPNARVVIKSYGVGRTITGPRACALESPPRTPGAPPMVCPLGDLGVGASATVTIDGTIGRGSLAESVWPTSDGKDSTWDNAWHATRGYGAAAFRPELGVGDRASRQSIRLRGRSVLLPIGCPKEVPTTCSGRADLALSTPVGGSKRLGGGMFALQPGTWARIPVTLKAAVRYRIRARHILNATVSVSYAVGATTAWTSRPAALLAR